MQKHYYEGLELALEREESCEGDSVQKLKVLHATDRHFRDGVNCKNYRLLYRLLIQNSKRAAHTGSYVKWMEALMKGYQFDEKNLILGLKFLAQCGMRFFAIFSTMGHFLCSKAAT